MAYTNNGTPQVSIINTTGSIDNSYKYTRPTGAAGHGTDAKVLHLDDVYAALLASALTMEANVKESLENYVEDPDVQANLQQLQYDLQNWNLALTTMTNMIKNMGDAMSSIVSNMR